MPGLFKSEFPGDSGREGVRCHIFAGPACNTVVPVRRRFFFSVYIREVSFTPRLHLKIHIPPPSMPVTNSIACYGKWKIFKMKLIFTQRTTLFDFLVPFGVGHGLGQTHFPFQQLHFLVPLFGIGVVGSQ